MAYTAWSVVAFEQPTAAKWNQLGDNDAYLKNAIDNLADSYDVAFKVGPSGSQAITTSTFTVVNFNSESYDIGNDFNTSTYAFVAPVTGYYLLSASGLMDSVADARRIMIEFYLNSATVIGQQQVHTGFAEDRSASIFNIYALTAGNSVQVRVWHDHGSNRNLIGSLSQTWFAGQLISI